MRPSLRRPRTRSTSRTSASWLAAKDVLQARKASMEERRQIEREAREKLLQEQEQRLEEQRGSDGMSEQLENRIRGILLGKA